MPMIDVIAARVRPTGIALLVSACLMLVAGQIQALPIEKVISSSNVPAWVSPDPAAKDVTVVMSWRDGFDPKTSKRGLSNVAIAMMGAGAGNLDEVDFKSAVQDLGATMRIYSSDGPRIGFQMTTKADKLDETLALAHSVLTEPRFADVDLMRITKTINNGRKSYFAAPQGKAQYAMAQVTMANDVLTRATLKPNEDVPTFTRADLITWHKQRFALDNLVIGLAGNLTSAQAGEIVDRLVAGLPATSAIPAMPMITYTGAGEVVLVPAESEQSILMVAGGYLPDAGPNEGVEGAAGDVLADYVGNGSSGRLFKKIREEKGLSYGITGSTGGGARGTSYVIGTSLPKDKVAEALGLVREVLTQVAQEGITDTDLAATKERLRARHGRGLTSSAAIAGTLNMMLGRGRPIDHWNLYPDNVAAVTKAQVDQLARTYLAPNKLAVLIVGDANGVSTTRMFPVN